VDNAESFSDPPEDTCEADSSSLSRPEVWEMIKEIGLMERHFQHMQHQYRVLASTWILAVFVATGFILTINEQNLFLPKELAVFALTIAGGIGITLLDTMDLGVYGMLLRGVFNEGLKFEEKYDWLPSVRTNHVGGLPYGDVQYIRYWYIAANAVVLFLGGTFFSLWSYRVGGIAYLSFAIVLACVIILSWCYYLYRKTSLRETSNASDR